MPRGSPPKADVRVIEQQDCSMLDWTSRKGLWVGGPLPLGYELKGGKLIVVEDEAERVRMIFCRYLEVSGINELLRDLRAKNV